MGEILSTAKAILSALDYLQNHGMAGGDIQPESIFFDAGVFKIYPNELLVGKTPSYSTN